MEPYEYLGFTISEDETPTFTVGGRIAKTARYLGTGDQGMVRGDSQEEVEKKIRDLLGK